MEKTVLLQNAEILHAFGAEAQNATCAAMIQAEQSWLTLIENWPIKMYKASVLMPAYNDARYIRDAIDSILGQTFTDFELIIVNDGSTDETPQILASYTDPRIRILYHPTNMGRAHARNTALNAAQGEYVL